ncbi:MAG: MoaD/ThiS family protein [bacterium]|nr:MoaD/ThiS family protein [bacterium]
MKIRLRLFANLKELAGTEALDLEMKEGDDVEALISTISSELPALREILEKRAVFISVNQEMAKDKDTLSEGDEVGLLPPFSGG